MRDGLLIGVFGTKEETKYDALYRIDEASKTIYVNVGVKCVAMMTFGEEEMELSFVESFPESVE